MIGRTATTATIAALFCAISISADAQSLSLAANPAAGPAPLSVTFTVSPMPAYDSAIDFGDGSAASQLRPAPSGAAGMVTHVYQANGRYLARLSAGSSVVGSAQIAVGQ
jgi:PKD repeat protein